ncbi:MAG: hypothetical protein U9R15_11005, partial [Chloroflexota bacterium]|nr:hypothetical protein [Chloroflexota bacterium]
MSSGLKFRNTDLHVHTPASRCFTESDVTPSLTYHLTFTYNGKEGDRLVDEFIASLPITEDDLQKKSLSYRLALTFAWGTFGHSKDPLVRINSLQLVV